MYCDSTLKLVSPTKVLSSSPPPRTIQISIVIFTGGPLSMSVYQYFSFITGK